MSAVVFEDGGGTDEEWEHLEGLGDALFHLPPPRVWGQPCPLSPRDPAPPSMWVSTELHSGSLPFCFFPLSLPFSRLGSAGWSWY